MQDRKKARAQRIRRALPGLGEGSGASSIQETLKRLAKAKNITLKSSGKKIK